MSEFIKKNINKSGENQKIKKVSNSLSENEKLESSGIAGSPLSEPVPNFIKSVSDEVIKGQNNTWIVLGRDRPGDRESGYGGRGDTQAGTIDIVVGRIGDEPKDNVFVNPDFFRDSARIYISQKTDVDRNFKLSKRFDDNVEVSDGMSAIALKADEIRIISRQNMRLITGTDKKNSKGSDIEGYSYGIDLIANNDNESLQPMVKGENLVKCLEDLAQGLEDLSGIVSTFLSTQMSFNAAVSSHYHYSPFYGRPTSPSISLSIKGIETSLKQLMDPMIGLRKSAFNSVSWKTKYLRPINEEEKNTSLHIISKYNKVN